MHKHTIASTGHGPNNPPSPVTGSKNGIANSKNAADKGACNEMDLDENSKIRELCC